MAYYFKILIAKFHYLILSIILILLFFSYFLAMEIASILKIMSWIFILLWIPFWFLRIMSDYYKPIVPIIILISLCIWFAYGLTIGFILVALLIISPILMLFSLKPSSSDWNNKARKAIMYLPLASLALSFIITREPLWFAGILIWGIWTLTSNISYNYFRPTFDILSKHDLKGIELNKNSLVFMSILFSEVLTVFICTNGVEIDFLRNLYLTSSQISLTLVGFLLAIQGVLSSTAMKSKTAREVIFEEELTLRSMNGLKGFMLIFITLFIISMLGAYSTRADSGSLQLYITWIVTPLNLYLADISNFLKTMLFVCFSVMFSFGIAYLYYLFLSYNLIVLPFKLSLSSRPVVIESISTSPVDDTIVETIRSYLYNETKLNGKLIRGISIYKHDYGLFASCELEVNFPDKNDLMFTTIYLSKILIERIGIAKVNVWIRSMQGKSGLIKIFQVELDKEKLKELEMIEDPLKMEQKFKDLGARIKDYAFKESQLL